MIIFQNRDCMEGMKEFPDSYFQLAIVDPPYYSGPEKRHYYGSKVSKIGVHRPYNPSLRSWQIPGKAYFNELLRVSQHVIIFGCNYFDEMPHMPGRIVWDKCNGNSTFSDAEIAATDLINTVRLFPYMWNGMFQGRSMTDGRTQQGNKALNEKRIHPTQKPIALYTWLLTQFAKPGYRILDTHVGSASSLLACKRLGLDAVGFEIDKKRFDAAQARMDEEDRQISMFDMLTGKEDGHGGI